MSPPSTIRVLRRRDLPLATKLVALYTATWTFLSVVLASQRSTFYLRRPHAERVAGRRAAC